MLRFILYVVLFYILFRLIRSILSNIFSNKTDTKKPNIPPKKKSNFENVEDAKYIEIKPEDDNKN